jgi:gluconolactonase
VPTGDIVTTNICFGGGDRKTAYITLAGKGEVMQMPWPRAGTALAYG